MVFAPTPRDYTITLNKKEKRAALKSALTSRVNENKFVVVDELKFDEVKTKNFKAVMNSLKVSKALLERQTQRKTCRAKNRHNRGAVHAKLPCNHKKQEYIHHKLGQRPQETSHTHIHTGLNVGIGSDDTLYAKVDGIVRFERLGRDKKQVSVYPVAQ